MNALPRWFDRITGSGGILAFHGIGQQPFLPIMHVSAEAMRRQIAFVASRYRVVRLSELLDRWRRRVSTRGCVAVTFDDAYTGVAHHAAAILADFQIPATIFVAAANATTGGDYWWDRAESARLAGAREWSELLASVGLAARAPGEDASAVLREHILTKCHGRTAWSAPHGPQTAWRSLTFAELATLAEDERFDFGVHTLTHPNLPSLPPGEQEHEMAECLHVLRARLPRVLPVIAYPYGLYDASTLEAAKRAGMVAGVTMEGRAPDRRPNLFTIPRVGLGEVHSNRSMSLRLNDACRPLIILRNRGTHARPHVGR